MSTFLPNQQFYFIVKCAGANYSKDVNRFVANNRSYRTREEAEVEAEKLAKATPGNRYYVTYTVSGFHMPEAPALQKNRW